MALPTSKSGLISKDDFFAAVRELNDQEAEDLVIDQRVDALEAARFGQIKTRTASHTLDQTDLGAFLRMVLGTPGTITVPAAAVMPVPAGFWVRGSQAGLGQVSFVFAAGVAVEAADDARRTAKQHAGFVLTNLAADRWHLDGYLVP